MAPIPSRPLGIRILQTPNPIIKIELFQDLSCPFSARMWKTLSNEVFNQVKNDEALKSQVEFIMHPVPQPWHPQSPCMHESLSAVQCAVNDDTTQVQKYLKLAFESQDKFTDLYMKDKSRAQIHEMCADMAQEAGICKGEVLKYLDFSHLTKEEPNMGLGDVTKRIKFSIKFHRKRGVHVTPTVFVNDVEDDSISSSFTADQWMGKIRSML